LGWKWIPIEEPLRQNIDFKLLGVLLQGIKDPDWEIMHQYEVGVRVGAGIPLPRTPAVFPEKQKWSLPGQANPEDEDSLEGAWLSNYASALEHSNEVEAILEDQVTRGQVFALSEEEAKKKYGKNLQVAALGAVIKETKPDGSVTVRVVHDVTNGVGLNQTIKVRDLCNLPMAPDLKGVLREAASSRRPHFGMKVDVKEAHHHIPINRRDWHRLACQVRSGGRVYFNMVGAFGVSSAPYWWTRAGASMLRLLLDILGIELPSWQLFFFR
jgi:hypothetical protein